MPTDSRQPENRQPALAPYFIKYRRVSTGRQAVKDVSLPGQRREQDDAIARLGGLALGDFEDGGKTGGTAARQGFQDALALCRSPHVADLVRAGHPVYLLVWKQSRAFRNRALAVTTKAELKAVGVRVLSITETFVGGETFGDVIQEGLQELVDEIRLMEVRVDTERGQRQMRDPRDPVTNEPTGRGRQSGQPPFGYRLADPSVQGAGWAVDEAAAPLVRRLFAECDGGATQAEMARGMNATGVRPPARYKARNIETAGHWLGTTIREILTNRAYVGEVKHNDPRARRTLHYPGAHEPLIDPDLFGRVQILIERRTKGRGAQARGLFSGLLRCPLCGARMYTETRRMPKVTGAKGGKPFQTRYSCGAQEQARRARGYGAAEPAGACPGHRVTERALLPRFLAALGERAALARGRSKALAGAAPLWPVAPAPAAPSERQSLERERGGLQAMRGRFQWQHGEGLMGDDDLKANLGRVEARLAAIAESLAGLRETPAPAPALTRAQVEDLRAAVTDESLTPAQKRDRLALAFEQIVPEPDGRVRLRLAANIVAAARKS